LRRREREYYIAIADPEQWPVAIADSGCTQFR
jgi:hypothetical protein